MPHDLPTPHPAEERLPALDALRGLALFGVLVVNLVMAFRVSIFQQFVEVGDAPGGLDAFAEALVRHAFELKAYALFSLLFGVGLAAQYERLQRSRRPYCLLARRLVILLALGAIHLTLIWDGDILVQYAVAGLLVLPFVGAPARAIACAAAAMLLTYLAMPLLPVPVSWPTAEALAQHVGDAAQVLPAEGWWAIRRFSWDERTLLLPLHVYIFPRTLGLMLLGLLAWRARAFSLIESHKRRAFAVSCAAILLGAWATLIAAYPGSGLTAPVTHAMAGAGALVLALGYAGAFLAAVDVQPIGRIARRLAPVGRMAFTNYILQSVVLGFVFFGYGLGLYNRTGAAAGLALAIAIFAAQAALSDWWLKRWRFGPLEWLWRSLMYGKAQPMKARPA